MTAHASKEKTEDLVYEDAVRKIVDDLLEDQVSATDGVPDVKMPSAKLRKIATVMAGATGATAAV